MAAWEDRDPSRVCGCPTSPRWSLKTLAAKQPISVPPISSSSGLSLSSWPLRCAAAYMLGPTRAAIPGIRAISVLPISCPCAIGIAAPLAESNLIHRLAKLGVIVRNRGCLKLLGRETTFIFDKTGTVTEGKFAISSGLDSLSTDARSLLKGLALKSTHPIASRNCLFH